MEQENTQPKPDGSEKPAISALGAVPGSAVDEINSKCCQKCASYNANADGFCVRHGFPVEAKEYCVEYKQNKEIAQQ